RIGNLRHAATTSATELRAAEGRLTAGEEARARADVEAETAEHVWNRASQRAGEIEQKLADARHREAVVLLRRELRLGQPCPVCKYPVAEHPPPLSTPALDALEKKFEQAKRAETEARNFLDGAKAAVAASGAAVIGEHQNVE